MTEGDLFCEILQSAKPDDLNHVILGLNQIKFKADKN